MAFFNGLNGKLSFEPKFVKKMVIDDSSEMNGDIVEKYDFEIKVDESYKWFNCEFGFDYDIDDLSPLKIEVEYIPFLLTIMRINNFIDSDNKNMLSVISSDFDYKTQYVLNVDGVTYTLNESANVTAVFIEREKDYFVHHFIFSFSDYQNFFDIKLNINKESLLDFYKNLLNEFNEHRKEAFPSIFKSLTLDMEESIDFDNNMYSDIDVIDYDLIKNNKDEFFNIYNISLEEIISNQDFVSEMKEYCEFVANFKDIDDDDIEEPEIEIDFMIEDMNDIEDQIKNVLDENSLNMERINSEIEDELIYMLEGIIEGNEDYDIRDIKLVIRDINGRISEDKVYENEKKLLLKLVNYYGKESILKKYDLLKDIFDYVDLKKDIENVYKVSEEKYYNDYRKWYVEILNKANVNVNKSMKN